MDIQVIQELQNQFDALSHNIPDEDIEFWFARELQEEDEHQSLLDRLRKRPVSVN